MLLGMHFLSEGCGWVCGSGGGILHYADSTLAVPDADRSALPLLYTLAAYPNPFNPTTTLLFSLPRAGHVTLTLYDVTGRAVETLTDRVYAAGTHTLAVDANALPSGTYFARLQSAGTSKTQKLLLLR
jgi:hypothetical protein